MGLVIWRSDEVLRKITEASKAAIDETTAEAAQEARAAHWWDSRAGARLERQTVSAPAKIDGARVSGRFGTTQRLGFYGLFLELRQPFLRPAADRVFPKLAGRIKDKVGD